MSLDASRTAASPGQERAVGRTPPWPQRDKPGGIARLSISRTGRPARAGADATRALPRRCRAPVERAGNRRARAAAQSDAMTDCR